MVCPQHTLNKIKQECIVLYRFIHFEYDVNFNSATPILFHLTPKF